MKRMFLAAISKISVIFSKMFGKKKRDGYPALELGKEVLGGNANPVGNPTPAQIQAAKDFIWEWMDEGNRNLMVGMATLSTHKRHGLYVKQIFIEMEGQGHPNLITHERMVIGQRYSNKPEYPPCAETA